MKNSTIVNKNSNSDITAEMLELIFPRVQHNNVKNYFLSKFTEWGINSTKDFTENLSVYFEHLNKISLGSKKEELKKFSSFLISKLKYNFNRVELKSALLPKTTEIKTLDEVSQLWGIAPAEINYNKILQVHFGTQFKEVYRRVTTNKGTTNVNSIEIGFARKIQKVDQKEPSLEFVWIEINDRIVLIHLPTNTQNSLDSLSTIPIKTGEYLRKLMEKKYNLFLSPNQNEKTIFNLYKSLTNDAERVYKLQVNDKLGPKVSSFSEQCLKALDNHNDLINVKSRISALFVQNEIRANFNYFKSQMQKLPGSIRALTYSDNHGSRSQISAGATNRWGWANPGNEINIEDSDAYFDTRSTILRDKVLKSILISWKANNDSSTAVRYTAYDYFIESHILTKKITKELMDNVFSKITLYEI